MLAASPVAHYRSALASLEDSPSSPEDRSVQESITQLSTKLRQLRRSIDMEADVDDVATSAKTKKTSSVSARRTAPQVSRSLQETFSASTASARTPAKSSKAASTSRHTTSAPVRSRLMLSLLCSFALTVYVRCVVCSWASRGATPRCCACWSRTSI